MPWSTVIGIGASLLGSSSAKKQASKDRALQREQMAMQQQAQEQSYAMALRQMDQQDDMNEYIRQIEQLNRITAADERQFQIGQLGQYQTTLNEERRYAVDRQVKADQDAARQRSFQLEQLLRNQNLSQQERQFAIQQLNEAKSIASGERAEDLQRFYQEREQAGQEREFMLGEYGRLTGLAQSERDYDLQMRERMMSEVYGLQDSLRETQSSLGYIPEIEQINPADIDAEINRRVGDYTADVDRATDRVASINEANLIRGGIDRSTPATARRADVASRMAQEYRNAKNQAYQDAVAYITGRSGAMTQNVNDIMNRRGQVLGETAAVQGSAIEHLMSLPQIGSAMEAMQFANLIPSGVYSRNIGSANNYSAPVDIGSSVYDRINVGSGMAEFFNTPSAAQYSGRDIGSAIINPYNYNMGDAGSSYMQMSGNIGNSMLSSATNMYNNSRDRYSSAGADVGARFDDFLKDHEKTISSWGRSLFGGSSGYNPTPMNSVGPMANGYRQDTLSSLSNWRV